ncbi:hypothetical protein [Deinococcus knuensis]|uniref:Cell division protein FtsL n=1 Tax=Deinococcus knuensis TaxID=1837380 RepID=A0ABQ2SER5_9DEIO|nr:hypothetical protein [Deinococcus knuensis]GGS16948.1 hypothetical protein GCM10008961_05730 [Deinococcus knuensis]
MIWPPLGRAQDGASRDPGRVKPAGLGRVTLRRVLPAGLTLDTSLPTWRGRAVRYVLIYLLMVVAMVTVRGATQHIRPELRAAQAREAELTTRRDTLALQLQSLENPQRLRSWAFANGMRRFTDANKVTETIAPLPSVRVPVSPERKLEVKTQWR